MAQRDPLNFFSPYERLPAGHENQLTRALLVLLRASPMAHVEWLRLVAPDRHLWELPAATFATQRHAVHRPHRESEDQAVLVSVFLTPESPTSGGGAITTSDRGQVLDGVIQYEDDLVVVIENKIFDADDLQARKLNLTGARVTIADGQVAVVVLWRDLLERLVGLRERGLVAGAEAALLEYFLVHVEDHFPDLGPFRNLASCGGVESRVRRRLRQVLGEALGAEVFEHSQGAWVPTPAPDVIGANAYLCFTDTDSNTRIELRMYPADTLTQARAFYTNPAAVHGVLQLGKSGDWEAGPNFHFGHMQRGYCWTTSTLDLDAYVGLWQELIRDADPKAGSIGRGEWDRYWRWLEKNRLAAAGDRPEFDQHFTRTNRSSASPRPGLRLVRGWSLADAERLDGRGEFAGAVREALDAALQALGEARLKA